MTSQDLSQTKKLRPIVVYAPSYNENSGGCVVLHALVDRLRRKGVEAYLYFYHPPKKRINVYSGLIKNFPERWRIAPFTFFFWVLRHIKAVYERVTYKPTISGFLNTPIANKSVLKAAVVVYPESVDGNPLNAKRIVRWLLNVPGYINQNARFSINEEFFYFTEVFKGEFSSLPKERHLHIKLVRNDCYYEPKKPEFRREGVCYLVWKGKKHGVSAEKLKSQGKLVIDGLSHQEIGDIFRRSEYLVSYTPNTMYLTYAILCGCAPVLEKPPEMTEAEFIERHPRERPGIAVGFSDVERAIRTRHELILKLSEEEAQTDKQIENFLAVIRNKYPFTV